MDHVPTLHRYEVQKLLELYFVWSFNLETECEKIKNRFRRPDFLYEFLRKLADNGVPYTLMRGEKKYSLERGFKIKL